jgi:molecular chaperone GrpE (heat shock protein)
MTNRPAPALPKWPFILADVLLLIACAWVINLLLPAKAYFAIGLAIVGWMVGAWVCVLPWLKEFQAECKLSESENLTSALEQIQKLEEVGDRVQAATATWQSAQDSAMRVTAAAKDIEEKVRADSKEFMEFAERINNDEKQHLRLEVEKLRRNEGEWLQVAARMLDHTFAITVAAHRSGQPNLAAQMNNFQNACRDAARRVGLVPFHPNTGDAYDERSQQLEDANAKPEEGAVVSDILATGYTFQGQLLRKALVRVSSAEQPPANEPQQPQQEEQAAPAPEPIAEEKTAVAEQAEETHQQHEQPAEPANQWERLEQSFEQQTESKSETAVVTEETAPVAEDSSSHDEEHLSEADTHDERVEEAPVARSTYDYPDEQQLAAEQNHSDHSHAEPVEVASAEHPTDQPPAEEGEKPRRRQRKPDPQTSLPF